MEKVTLPALSDLYKGELAKEQNDLSVLLNQSPHPSWIKDHPYATKIIVTDQGKRKVPIKYIPIERIEWLLTRIFTRWNVEIREVKLIANSVAVTIRLKYCNPITCEYEQQDGIGAMPLQTDKDCGAIDFNKIKSNAVQLAAPAAESYAIKDAAEKIGKLFGSDLNRADQIGYNSLLTKLDTKEEKELASKLKDITNKLENCSDLEELGLLWDNYTAKEQADQQIKKLFTDKKIEINGKENS